MQRQAHEVGVDVGLVDADLVDPHDRLAMVALDKVVAPPLQLEPLGRRAVAPRVRYERVALAEQQRDRPVRSTEG